MSESEEVFWRYLPQTRRSRFTVVEYLIGVFLIVIAARVALPWVLDWSDRNAAWEVLESIATVEEAARTAAGNDDFDALRDARPGQIPEGLVPYLPPEFSFVHDRWSMDWDLYRVEGPAREFLVGDAHGAIEVRIESDRVRAAVMRAAGPRVWLVEDDRISILVPDLGSSGGSSDS